MSETLRRAAKLAKLIQENPTQEEMEEDKKFLENKLMSIPTYFSAVISHEIVISVSRFTLDPERYRERCEMMDSRRRLAHEVMTMSINQINRLCKIYDTESIFSISEELDSQNVNDRAKAAICAYEFCKEIFMDTVITDVKSYTEREIDQELYQYALGPGNPFKTTVRLEDIIAKANN